MDQTIKKITPPAIKTKVALEALKGIETTGQLASKFSVHPVQVGMWRRLATDAIEQFFKGANKRYEQNKAEETEELYRKIGRLEVENDFLKKKMGIIS